MEGFYECFHYFFLFSNVTSMSKYVNIGLNFLQDSAKNLIFLNEIITSFGGTKGRNFKYSNNFLKSASFAYSLFLNV